jgi:hypothetical protein
MVARDESVVLRLVLPDLAGLTARASAHAEAEE